MKKGWKRLVSPMPPSKETGKSVGLSDLTRGALSSAATASHWCSVTMKSDAIGGLLRCGIPDFKLEKAVIDRRLSQMRAEGVSFEVGVNIGVDVSVKALREKRRVAAGDWKRDTQGCQSRGSRTLEDPRDDLPHVPTPASKRPS